MGTPTVGKLPHFMQVPPNTPYTLHSVGLPQILTLVGSSCEAVAPFSRGLDCRVGFCGGDFEKVF